MIHKNSKRYQGVSPHDQMQPWENMKTNSPRFALSFLHLIPNGINGVNINLLTQVMVFFINVCIFSKGTQPFDFIKPNIIGKLAYKVKYISQVSAGMIMVFFNLIRFFKISSRRINAIKRSTNNIVQCSKC